MAKTSTRKEIAKIVLCEGGGGEIGCAGTAESASAAPPAQQPGGRTERAGRSTVNVYRDWRHGFSFVVVGVLRASKKYQHIVFITYEYEQGTSVTVSVTAHGECPPFESKRGPMQEQRIALSTWERKRDCGQPRNAAPMDEFRRTLADARAASAAEGTPMSRMLRHLWRAADDGQSTFLVMG